jgi:hypothetical protein
MDAARSLPDNDDAAPPEPAARPTPVMEQYIEIKAANPDCLLFYRMGDFYELFFEDAEVASRALGIVLTKRGKHLGRDIPMCGVPVHRADEYLHRLIAAGLRVAVCEQTEDPAEAKKRGSKSVVRRNVVRLVTPGTLTEDTLLDARRNNYLLAVVRARASSANEEARFGIAWIDISTGEFRIAECDRPNLAAEIARLEPGEIIVSDALYSDPELAPYLRTLPAVTPLTRDVFDGATAERRLCDYFAVATTDAFGALPNHISASAKSLLPDVISEHDHGGCTRAFVGLDQGTAENRRDAHELKGRGRNLGHRDRFGIRPPHCQQSLERAIGAELFHRFELLPPDHEVVQQSPLVANDARIAHFDLDDAVAFRERNCGTEEIAGDVVPAGAKTDRNRNRQPAGNRQPWILHQHPQAELQVHPRYSCVHELCPPVPAALDREPDRQRGRMSPISPPRALRTVCPAIALKEFVEITGNRFTDIGRQDAVDDRSREARRMEAVPARRWRHRAPRKSMSRPRHMLSSAFRDARRLSSPAAVTLTCRRALPPRSPVDAPIHDTSKPFSSRRRSVTYTAAGATSRPVRRAISSTIGTP